MLEIPQLGSVPRTYTLHQASPMAARTALALLAAGHLSENRRPASAPELVQAGLQAWLDGNTRGLRFYDFTLHYGDRDIRQPEGATLAEVYKRRIGISLHSNSDHPCGLTIGRKLRRLPQAIAETALHWINIAGAATLPIYMPSNTLQLASWVYWQGCNDESEVLEQMRAEKEDPATYNGPTRAEFDAAIPDWLANPKKRLTMDSIKALAASKRSGPDVSVGRAIFTLIGALAEYRKRIDTGIDPEEEPTTWPPAIALWYGGTDSLMGRVYDDFGEDLSNSGEYRDYWAAATIVDGPSFERDLKKFMHGVEPVFPILRTLETLLSLITDRKLG